MGAVILAKVGLGGVGMVVALRCALPCAAMLASASTSSAILMSSMSGADLRLSMWMSDRRVAVSSPVIVVVMAIEVAEAASLGGAVSFFVLHFLFLFHYALPLFLFR